MWKMWKVIWQKIKNFFFEFCTSTSLHGFRHITTKQMSLNEKRIWAAFLVLSTGFLVFLTERTVRIMLDESISIQMESVDNSMKELDFPAVTICNHNQIYKPNVGKFKKKLTAVGYSDDEIDEFLYFLPVLTNPFQKADLNINLYNRMLQNLTISVKSLMLELMQPCAKLLSECEFMSRVYNCSTIFKPVESYRGYCCAFNYHASPTIIDHNNLDKCKKFYRPNDSDFASPCKNESECPGRRKVQKVSASGINSGLYFRLYSEPENYFGITEDFEGATIIFHESHDFPESDIFEQVVQSSKQISVIVSGIKVENELSIRHLPKKQRRCVYSPEVQFDYSFQSCIAKCRMIRFAKICDCVPFYYPRTCINITSNICNFSSIDCIKKNQDLIQSLYKEVKLKNGFVLKKCHCYHVCLKTKFNIYQELASIYLGVRYPFLINYENYSHIKEGFNFSKVYIYFQDYTFIKYKRRLSSPWYTTIGSLGGLLGLCLGGSCISLLEPFIQFFMAPFRKTYNQELEDKKLTNENSKFFKKIPLKERVKEWNTLPIDENFLMLQSDFKEYINFKKSNLL